jgi:3-dehydroquinate synthase
MERLEKSINGSNIKIIIGSGLEGEINKSMENYSKNISFISRNVNNKYRKKIGAISSKKSFILDGEKSKSIKYFNMVIKKLLTMEIERGNSISYIGGGTTGDLVGYAASVYKRGVHLTAIPTSLLSQVDSSIGGKNALNFNDVKNVIGTFYNPDYIFDDIDFLVNSDPELLKDGIAEAMKMALTCDKPFFDYFMKNTLNSVYNKDNLEYVIAKSIKIKLDIISRDFFDTKKIRYILNFGHSIGHALESYSQNQISHGTAVANGMLLEAYISYKSGLSEPYYDSIRSTISGYGIPIINFKNIETDKLLWYIKNDKKVEGKKLNMVMLEEKGKAAIGEIDFQQLRHYINDYRDML